MGKGIMPSCYISSGCFKTNNIEEIVALSLQHGFDIELSSALALSPSALDTVCNANGRLRYLVHNYFPTPDVPFVLNLASTDPEIHHQSVALCKNAIDLCAKLGAPFYSVHAGFALNLRPEDLGNPVIQGHLAASQTIPRDAAYERFVITIQMLASYAAAQCVGLLVENNVVARENLASDGTYPLLLADVSEIRVFLSDISNCNVGLLLDVGHAKVSSVTIGILIESYFEVLTPFIRCLHLSDNNGLRDTNSTFTGNVWFAPYLKGFAAIPKVIEVNNLTIEEINQQMGLVAKLSINTNHCLQ